MDSEAPSCFLEQGGSIMNRAILLACLAAALAGGPASHAQDRMYEPPVWRTPPDPNLAAELMPGLAGLMGISGRATIRCLAVEDGHPFRCHVADERPSGLGFGSAARLTVASGEVRAARSDGHVVPRWISSTVNFMAFDLDQPVQQWTGPEPSEEGLALARRVVETDPTVIAPTMDDLLAGLDVDRRAVITSWIDELLPGYVAMMTDAPAIQLARVLTPDALRTILSGGYVPTPDDETYEAAFEDVSAEDVIALREIRRRYCERWNCSLEP